MNKFRPKSNSNSLPLPVQTGTTNALSTVLQCDTVHAQIVQCAAQYTAH